MQKKCRKNCGKWIAALYTKKMEASPGSTVSGDMK